MFYVVKILNNGKVYKSNYTTHGINPFIQMNGLSNDAIIGLTTDKDGNVYAGSYTVTIYKSDGIKRFTVMEKINSKLFNLTLNVTDNLYVVGENAVYKS